MTPINILGSLCCYLSCIGAVVWILMSQLCTYSLV